MSSLPQTPSPEPPVESFELGVAEALKFEKTEVTRGLVPAAQLPSAADVLAQLFPPEEEKPQKLAVADLTPIGTPAEENLLPGELQRSAKDPYDPYSLTAPVELKASEVAVAQIGAAAETSSEEPASTQTDESAINPANESTQELVQELANASVAEAVTEPGKEPAKQPVTESIEKPGKESYKESYEDSTKAPISALHSAAPGEAPIQLQLALPGIGLGEFAEPASAGNAAAPVPSLEPPKDSQDTQIAAAPPLEAAEKAPKQRGEGSFARIASSIRRIFGAGGAEKNKQTQDSAHTVEAAVTQTVSEAPETISSVPIVAEASATPLETLPPAQQATSEMEAIPPFAPFSAAVEAPGRALATAEIATTSSTITGTVTEEEHSISEPPVAFDSSEVSQQPAEASAVNMPVESPATEAPSQEAAASQQQPDSLEQSFQEQAANNDSPQQFDPPPQEMHPDNQDAVYEDVEEVDSSDDDQAIASAIERYANLTAAAQAELSPDAATPQADLPPSTGPAETFSSAASSASPYPDEIPSLPASSSEPVDINAVLGIPRDPEPANPDFASARFAPKASANERPSALTNVPAYEPPESNPLPTIAAYRDWSFEEKLASHHEWIESKGTIGNRADLTDADLEGSDLIGVDLRFVDLHDANLRAADLLMADLRDACLVRANFRDSCLVGANLEAANLEGASLETAMGLVPRQLAGTNLHEAVLPQSILQFEALGEFKRASRRVHGFFVALMSMCALSALLISMTKDFQLVTNSAVLFFLHSAAAAASLPTVQFYLIGPLALFVIYLVFQFHLQHLWDLTLALPAVFPDGHELGENEPRIVLGLLRAHFRWMNTDAPSTRFVEKGISIFLAYWLVPITLMFYWVRFLTLQELRGTVLQELLVVCATGVALYSTTKVGKPAERWLVQENFAERMLSNMRSINPVTPSLVLLGILTFLAAGTMMGVPHNKDRAPQFMAGSPRRWAPSVLWSFGIDPYADLTEAVISKKPANWNGADDQVSSVTGANLNGANFRYAQAYRAFMANSHLLNADLQGAFLSQADLRGSDLGQSNLKYAMLDQALMNHVNLDRARLDGANLSRADLRAANLSYAAMGNATLVDARLDGATLYGAKLIAATLIRTNFEKADLREAHLDAANLEHVDMQGAYLWSARLTGTRLANAQLGKAIFVNADLRGADLRWAQLSETVLTGADLSGAYLDGADMRGAVGFGANQICSAKSRHGLLLDDAMQLQVTAQCGPAN